MESYVLRARVVTREFRDTRAAAHKSGTMCNIGDRKVESGRKGVGAGSVALDGGGGGGGGGGRRGCTGRALDLYKLPPISCKFLVPASA